jgi:hypothetical protein
MRKRTNTANRPREAIKLSTYSQLDLYLAKFAAGELGLVLLLGRHGTGKSESVKRAFGAVTATNDAEANLLYVEGHVKAYGLYASLWAFRDRPVILDDLDRLYADADCVRLLKPLCNSEPVKRVAWLTNLTLNSEGIPFSFSTTSRVILIANEWRTLNPNVRALEDRAIILHFDPSNAEVHRQVATWFRDADVYRFIAGILPSIKSLSMRHYWKASQLRRAGLADWRESLLDMVLPDPRLVCVAALQHDPGLGSERERVKRFVEATGYSRATYFRAKARLANTSLAFDLLRGQRTALDRDAE